MKRTHLAIGIEVIVLALSGCNNQQIQPSTNDNYVISHHCTSDGKLTVAQATTIVQDGKEISIGGGGKPYYSYDCPNGVNVFIDYDEAHPNIVPSQVKP